MTNEVVIREFVKAKATDIDYGIFRARVVEDTVDDICTVEFGSRGGWDNDGGTIILTRGELNTAMEVLNKAQELMNSIPDDDDDLEDGEFSDDLDDDEEEFCEDLIDDEELDEEWEDA